VGLLLSACAPRVDLAAERASLMQTSRDWAKTVATRDVETIAAYWSDSAIMFPPGQAPLAGRAAIKQYVTEAMKIPNFSISWEPKSATVAASGDIGWLVERNSVTYADAKGNLVTEHGNGITTWRKDASGAWKCVLDIWNPDPQPAAASPAK
jgi:ketosteroid isomerase-like protein